MSDEPRYLHGHADSVLRSHRRRTAESSAAYFLEVLEPDWVVLDLGCGPGTITAGLGRRVPDGAVIGIDASAGVLHEAAVASPATPLLAADLYALPLPDGSVDAVHLHMVLQHVSDPVGALASLQRVVRPGGVIAARDSDYSRFSWSPDSPGLERWLALYRQAARVVGGEPDAGAHLGSWADAAGLEAVESASSMVYESAEDRMWWGSLWSERIVASSFAETVLEHDLASAAELAELSEAWMVWANAPEGRFEIPCGEILARC